MQKKLSIIVPIYNEKSTILETLKRVDNVVLDLEKEMIVVDDCSTDGSVEILKKLDSLKYKVFFKNKNEGKGAALKVGLQKATGDIVIIQDADLEYDPADYPEMISPILAGRADVVYGSRFISGKPKRVLFFWHYLGNTFLTFLSNLLTGLNLTDMETGYKAFNREVADYLKDKLTSKRFGVEPEITALIAKRKYRIYEVGIAYYGRDYSEGKKINWRDGLAAVWHIIKFNIFSK